ncbi:MAG: hypothetical protein FWD64_07015, partial [Acidobacteriaceae bacterium]|nr:hypothetical protein [Acidobacteriaceae bacterium]
LQGDTLLDIARRAGADAIHPGDGLLAEDAEFAEACSAVGITFVGPTASALRALSSKAIAEQAVAAGCVPPEKLTTPVRHIEIQLIVGKRGSSIHLGERECTVERQNQKIIIEAPSAVADDLLRKMSRAAARLLEGSAFRGAGFVCSVEFLVDAKKNFCLHGVVPRLSDGCAVTEAVTGLDIVQMQLRMAMGETLKVRQAEPRGHALQCTIHAEDPENNFLPAAGRITRLMQPSGPGVREDSVAYVGWNVTSDAPEQSPLLSRLVASAETREAAISRMLRALGEYTIGGVRTNLPLLRQILKDAEFRAAKTNTKWLERFVERTPPGIQVASGEEEVSSEIVALAAAFFAAAARGANLAASPSLSKWSGTSRKEGLRG